MSSLVHRFVGTLHQSVADFHLVFILPTSRKAGLTACQRATHRSFEETLSERHNGWDLSNQPVEGKEESVINPPQPYTGLPATSPMSLTCIPNTHVSGLLKDNCTQFKVATKKKNNSLAFHSMYSLTPAMGQKREQMTYTYLFVYVFS